MKRMHIHVGVGHLGSQVDEDSELQSLRENFKNADLSIFDQGETTCCYARSDKSWVKDPTGIGWEAYKTMEDVNQFSIKQATDDEAGITSNKCCAAN
jgi:hypothetical protein